MRKLIIQIPCFNEEATLPGTLVELPRAVPGYDVVEWLVIDDGSEDRTTETARDFGADHVFAAPVRQGLSRTFYAGICRSLELGADTIINTDGDNQYCAKCIPALLVPILDGTADIVIGERCARDANGLNAINQILHFVGSWAVSVASGTRIPDASSGFRAFTREAAAALIVFNRYTYTSETLIQASRAGLRIASVPVQVNGPTRASRLFNSEFEYVARSIGIIVRAFITYRPLLFFSILAGTCMLPGACLGLRFMVFYLLGGGAGHVQSLILGAVLIMASVVFVVAGILADLTATNRMLLEDIRVRLIAKEHLENAAASASPTSIRANLRKGSKY